MVRPVHPGPEVPAGRDPDEIPELVGQMRLVAIAAFLLCVAVVISIVRTLVPARYAWLWGLLLATSIVSMQDWVLQLRGDFPGIFFSLLALRLLLARNHYATLFKPHREIAVRGGDKTVLVQKSAKANQLVPSPVFAAQGTTKNRNLLTEPVNALDPISGQTHPEEDVFFQKVKAQ